MKDGSAVDAPSLHKPALYKNGQLFCMHDDNCILFDKLVVGMQTYGGHGWPWIVTRKTDETVYLEDRVGVRISYRRDVWDRIGPHKRKPC